MKNAYPIDPTTHGILDYVIAGTLLAAPYVLGFDEAEKEVALTAGSAALAINLFTDHPVSIKKEISFEDHRKADINILATIIGGAYFTGALKKPKPRAFFLGMFIIGIANVIFTNWKAASKKAIVNLPDNRLLAATANNQQSTVNG